MIFRSADSGKPGLKQGPLDMSDEIRNAIAEMYKRRQIGQALSQDEFCLLLMDTLADPRPFMSPHWRARHGGVRFHRRRSPEKIPKKLLVLQWPSALGDAAMCTEFFSGLRRKYPYAEIFCLTGRTGAELHRANPAIDVVIENPLDDLLGEVLQGRDIRKRPVFDVIKKTALVLESHAWDLLINLQVVPVSAAFAKLVRTDETIGMTLSHDGMPVIYGNVWSAYLFGVSANLMRDHNIMHRRALFCKMIDCDGTAMPPLKPRISDKAMGRAQALYDLHHIQDDDFLVGMAPLSTWRSKTWDHYHELADRLAEDKGGKVIMFGAGGEKRALLEIADKARSQVVVAAGLTIEELMAALCGCDLVVGNDTGPLHVASSLGKKVVGIFGPTSIQEVGPWGNDWVALQYETCRQCYRPACDKETACMEAVRVDHVLKALMALFPEMAGFRDAKTSTEVKIYAPHFGFQHEPNPQAVICQLYLEHIADSGGADAVFRNVSWYADPETTEEVLLACLEFKSKMKRLIADHRYLEGKKIDVLLQQMGTRAAVLKNIEIINSMRFLDKRPGQIGDMNSWRQYYGAMLEEAGRLCEMLEYVLANQCMERMKAIPGPSLEREGLMEAVTTSSRKSRSVGRELAVNGSR